MSGSTTLTLVIGGVFSIAVAVVSGVIANLNARATSRASLDAELGKIAGQIKAQEDVRTRQEIADLRSRYLVPLRYFASALSGRLAEVEDKLSSPEGAAELKDWFETVKKHVTADSRLGEFDAWCYYEGIFSMTTLYYTFSYFHWANEIRLNRPFSGVRQDFGRALEQTLTRVGETFVWVDGRDTAGIWGPSQEIIGELFTADGAQLSYTQMCREFSAAETSRRAPYFRPVDFYWRDLPAERGEPIRVALDQLVEFLDREDPHLVSR
jgi:hypothetical protein